MLSIKPVVIMGATSAGKTKLSIDVSKAISGEVVNTDKMQIYDGLDITTNKVLLKDRSGIPYHLIGTIASITDDFPVSLYRSIATTVAKSIVRRGHIPVLVGGSNSLIHGFLVDHLDTSLINPFAKVNYRPILRFQSCLLWVKCHELVLKEYINRHVDDMVDAGLVRELKEYFDFASVHGLAGKTGLNRAIGVRELWNYFEGRSRLHDSLDEMKANTYALAEAQTTEIRHIADAWKWAIHSLNATETIQAHLISSDPVNDLAWEHNVHGPALAAVIEFLGC